jgi:hypothetical protein
MRGGNPVRACHSHKAVSPVGVLIPFAAVAWGGLYFLGAVTGTFNSIRSVVQPHLPDWLVVSILLLSPVIYALATLPSTGPAASVALAVVFGCQTILIGLGAAQHPILYATVVLFTYVEAISIIPRRNARLSGKSPFTVLEIEPSHSFPKRSDPLEHAKK